MEKFSNCSSFRGGWKIVNPCSKNPIFLFAISQLLFLCFNIILKKFQCMWWFLGALDLCPSSLNSTWKAISLYPHTYEHPRSESHWTNVGHRKLSLARNSWSTEHGYDQHQLNHKDSSDSLGEHGNRYSAEINKSCPFPAGAIYFS